MIHTKAEIDRRVENYKQSFSGIAKRKIALALHGMECCNCHIRLGPDDKFVFHHVIPELKRCNVSALFKGHDWTEAFGDELKKCVLLCENCHVNVHHRKQKLLGQVYLWGMS